MEAGKFGTVDEYLEHVPISEQREVLQQLRKIIQSEAPAAKECISYGMPGYKLGGYLVGFAAFKHHCSFFPGAIVEEFADQLTGFKTSKGTIQFSPSSPLPEQLVRQIIRTRIASRG